MRKCTKLPHVFPDDQLELPLLSALRALPFLYAGIVVLFTMLDPQSYYVTARCRVRPRGEGLDDAFQLAFSNALAGLAIFGFCTAYFQQSIIVVRLYVSPTTAYTHTIPQHETPYTPRDP